MTEHGPVTALSEDDCWRLLRDHEFGRLAFHLADEVHIVPINYAVASEGHLVFRTAEGSKLLGLTMNADVAFEIDEFGEDEAWSVVVRGRANQLEGERARATQQMSLRPWLATAKYNVVSVDVDELTGRHFDLERPWLHMRPQEGDAELSSSHG